MFETEIAVVFCFPPRAEDETGLAARACSGLKALGFKLLRSLKLLVLAGIGGELLVDVVTAAAD